jgi:hypothetical protein
MFKKHTILVSLTLLTLLGISCKKDFSSVGNNMIEQPNFKGKIYEDAKVLTYDKQVNRIYTKNMALNGIGIYNDPVYGVLEGDMARTIVFPSSEDIDEVDYTEGFGDNVKLLKAKLVAPFFSHTFDDNGTTLYDIDSIYGNQSFDIDIYELTYLLDSNDPNNNLHTRRDYYSDFDFSPFKGPLIGSKQDFAPNYNPYITYERETDGSYKLDNDGHKIVKDSLGPQFVIDLDTTYFRHKIFDHSGEDILTNNLRFADYFRGVYVDAIPKNNNGRYFMIDFTKAHIEVSYTHDVVNDNNTPADTSDDFIEKVYNELILTFGVPSVNLYKNTFNNTTLTNITTSDEVNGDEKAYIKGNAGATTIIKLFDPTQLREIKNEDWLINHAELIFYVDDNLVAQTLSKPTRLFLYDYNNNTILADIKASENITTGNSYFGGVFDEDENGNHFYKFNITRHIRNIIKKDSLNVKLGLKVISGNKMDEIDNKLIPDNYNPKGIILHGNNTTDVDKKPKLTIYYSDPE